jgi:tetratricopeptide (TPR) repeat protein
LTACTEGISSLSSRILCGQSPHATQVVQVRWLAKNQDRFLPGILAVAQQAVSVFPEKAASWLRLAAVLNSCADPEAAQRALLEAVDRIPENLQLRLALARAQAGLHQYEQALETAEAAQRQYPTDRAARLLKWHVLLDAKSQSAQSDQINALPALLALCNVVLADCPGHTDATLYKAKALAKLGRPREASSVLSLDRYISIEDLAPPPSYPNGESFRQTLADEIRANPTLEADPRRKATRGGLQTTKLWQPTTVAVPALLDQIQDAVEVYAAQLPADPTGFVMSRPSAARLNSWAVIYGAEGRQKSHWHSSGWLSGVFYVAAPRKTGENAYRGRLVLGALDAQTDGFEPPWGTIDVEPVPGRLVLFPSFVPHATEGTGVDGARISVAFDVVPVAENNLGAEDNM